MSTTTERESSVPHLDVGTSPKRVARPSWVFLASALALGGLFWMIPFAVAPGHRADTLVLFRPNGDWDYLPQVAGIAHLNFGEVAIKELARTGVRSFPFASFVIHGFLQGLAGPFGFMLADILIIFLYACALRYLLVLAAAGPWAAELLSLLVVSRAATIASERLFRLLHLPTVARFWELRFPRPFVTELYVVCFLIVALMLAAQPRKGKGTYALFGVALALLLQSDIYWASIAAMVLAGVCVMALAAVGVRPMLTRLVAMGLAFGLTAAPMMYQQLHTSLDVKLRFGVFTTTDYRLLLLTGPAYGAALAALAAAGVFAWRSRSNDPEKRRRPALAVAGMAIAASLVAEPLFMAVLRQATQVAHYDVTAARALGYAVLLYVGWVLTDLAGLAPIRNLPRRPKMSLAAGTTVLTIIVCLYSEWRLIQPSYTPAARNISMGDEPLSRWDIETDFPALKRVLDSMARDKGNVLGTFDLPVARWWEYRGRYLYMADNFNSTVGENVLESRLFEFLRRVGTTPDELERLVEDPYIVAFEAGQGRYQVGYAYVPWPLEEYSAETQRQLRTAPLAARWFTFEVPRSERLRMRKAFEESGSHSGSGHELDAIVFDKDHLRPYVHPERMTNLHLVWENRTFEVWEPEVRQ